MRLPLWMRGMNQYHVAPELQRWILSRGGPFQGVFGMNCWEVFGTEAAIFPVDPLW